MTFDVCLVEKQNAACAFLHEQGEVGYEIAAKNGRGGLTQFQDA